MNYFYVSYCIILYFCIVLKVQHVIKIDNENNNNWKKLVALNNKFSWFRMAWTKPIKGKTRQNPVKPENSIKIKKLKKWENFGKTKAKPAWNIQAKCSNNTQGIR